MLLRFLNTNLLINILFVITNYARHFGHFQDDSIVSRHSVEKRDDAQTNARVDERKLSSDSIPVFYINLIQTVIVPGVKLTLFRAKSS